MVVSTRNQAQSRTVYGSLSLERYKLRFTQLMALSDAEISILNASGSENDEYFGTMRGRINFESYPGYLKGDEEERLRIRWRKMDGKNYTRIKRSRVRQTDPLLTQLLTFRRIYGESIEKRLKDPEYRRLIERLVFNHIGLVDGVINELSREDLIHSDLFDDVKQTGVQGLLEAIHKYSGTIGFPTYAGDLVRSAIISNTLPETFENGTRQDIFYLRQHVIVGHRLDGRRIVGRVDEQLVSPDNVQNTAERTLLGYEFNRILQELTPKQRRVLELRFGLEDGDRRTLEEVGAIFGHSRQWAHSIEQTAHGRLRYPRRARRLKAWLK